VNDSTKSQYVEATSEKMEQNYLWKHIYFPNQYGIGNVNPSTTDKQVRSHRGADQKRGGDPIFNRR
jgi:hypothetical protein